MIYIRDYSYIEGKKFWRNYSLVGDFLKIKKTFWETYPEPPTTKKITIGNIKYITKIIPKIDVYFSNNTFVSNVGKMIREFIPVDSLNKDIFFTLKNHNDFLREKIDSLNFYNFNKYNIQPQHDVHNFRVLPNYNTPRNLYKSLILSNNTVLLPNILPLSRPIRINNLEPGAIRKSDFENLPKYKQGAYLKLFGKKATEPINQGKHIPTFINAAYITVEFSPFIDDESTYLNELINFFENYEKDWNIYRNDITDIKYFIYHLENDEILKKRSKIDILVEYIKTHKKQLLNLKLIRRLYKYEILTEGHKVDNGLYVIRTNNKLSNFIYCLKFDSPEEYWRVYKNKSYIESKKIVKNYNEKNYYYIENNKRFKLLPYLVIKDCKLTTQKKSLPQFFGEIKKEKQKKIFKVIYIIKERYYYSDEVMVDINLQTRTLLGTVRPKGVKIIYFVK